MSRRVSFIRPIYRGTRFDDHTMPVELLPDLAAYQELVAETAGELFRLDHPTRKRLPKNFTDAFHLKLRAIDPGSAAPALERLLPDGPGLFGSTGDYFERARDVIERTMIAAAGEAPLPLEFPRHLLSRFNGIGQGLRDDEHVEWRAADRSDGPRYDRATRKRLILSNASTYEQHVDLTGRLVAFDEMKRQIELMVNQRRVPVVFNPEQMMDVRALFAVADPVTRLTGVGEFDSNDQLRKVVSLSTVVLVGDDIEPDLDARLVELAGLVDGWLDGEGRAPDPATLTAVRNTLCAVAARGLPTPFLYPTVEGGLRAEWPCDDIEVSALFEPATTTVWLHAASIREAFQDESTLATDDDAGIAAFLSRFAARAPVVT